MSFFGLTSFGPENFIKSNQKNSNGFTLFSDEEFKQGFEKITKSRNTPGKLYSCDIKNFLSYSFGFTPLDDEINLFQKISNIGEKEYLTVEEIIEVVHSIRSSTKETAEQSRKYTSFKKYYDDTYKHVRKEATPSEIYKTPVTYGQSYGFHQFSERNLNDVRYPIIKCEETKFGEVIAKTGKHLMK